jgi:predicted membrane channel-forming protein YqfA (hemolysin III family)
MQLLMKKGYFASTAVQRRMEDTLHKGHAQLKSTQTQLEEALPRLAHYMHLPDQEMRNLYIDVGYRLNYRFGEALRSLFEFHNETMNIWSHLLSFLGLLVAGWLTLENYTADKTDTDRLIVILYVAGTGICLLSSVCYHSFGCLSRQCHDLLLNCDLFGITLNIATTILPFAYYGYACDPVLQWRYMVMVMIILPIGLVVSIFGSIDRYGFLIRTVGFCTLSSSAIVPVTHLWLSTPSSYEGVFWLQMQGWMLVILSYVVGVTLYIIKLPEKIFPEFTRHTSINSHTLWHLCVTSGVFIGLFQIGNMQQTADDMSCNAWELYNSK